MAPNPRCFLDLSLGENPLGRVVFELFAENAPKTVENFRALCTGSEGVSKTSGIPLSYQGSIFHRIIPEFMIQGGDFTKKNGTGGESIYGGMFEDEDLKTPVDKAGLLVMANRGPATNSSQFFITLAEAPHLTGKHVVFGRVVSGIDHIRTVESLPTDSKDRPLQPVTVTKSGELELRKKPVGETAPTQDAPPPRRRRSPSITSSSSEEGDRSSRRKSRKRRSSNSSSSDSSDSDSDSDDDRRRQHRKSKSKAKRAKESKKAKGVVEDDDPRDERGIPLNREETDAEIDARLEREDEEREAKRKTEELERIKRELEKGGRSGRDDRGNGSSSGAINYKGRGSMRHKESGSTADLPSYSDRFSSSFRHSRGPPRSRELPPHKDGGTGDRAARFDTWKHDLAGGQPRSDERFVRAEKGERDVGFTKAGDKAEERGDYVDRDDPKSVKGETAVEGKEKREEELAEGMKAWE